MNPEKTAPEKVQQDEGSHKVDMAAAPALPPLAAKADDLESLKKTVEDAASVGAALWFSYIFVLFYIAVAAGGVTHVDLLLERPVKLPFLNVELPLTAFFFLAPIIFFIVHVYVLTHFVLLGRKAKRFHEELLTQIPGRDKSDQDAAKKRDKLRSQLPSNVFVQFLAGPRDVRDGAFGVLLRAIAYVTLVFGPLALLLLLQLQFLPYHNIIITWVQRIAFVMDISLIWWLWRDIVSGRGDYKRWFQWTKWGMPLLGGIASLTLVLFSFFVATSPDEQSPLGPNFFSPKWFWVFGPSILEPVDQAKELDLRAALFEGPVDEVTRRPKSLFSNRLVLPGFDLLSELKIDDKKIDRQKHIFSFRGRNFQNAVFDLSELPKVDLNGANLQGASLYNANLQGASLDGASLKGASLDGAKLQGASLDDANLQGASLKLANLQGAALKFANLQGAALNHANLQGAALKFANLQGASLGGANLQGASLGGANLQGLALKFANLQGAALDVANLQGAALDDANLQGAALKFAKLQGAALVNANLQGAALNDANLQGASLDGANLQGASLDGANLQATSFSGARVWRTFFPEHGEILIAIDLNWLPSIKIDGHEHPWTDKNYNDLRSELKITINDAESREKALDLISILDCAKKDQTPCVDKLEKAKKPQAVADFENLKIDSTTYRISLAKILTETVCNDPDNGIYVLRGTLKGVLREAAPIIFKELQDKDTCPVAAKLTENDKEDLKRAELEANKIARNESITTPKPKQRLDKKQSRQQQGKGRR